MLVSREQLYYRTSRLVNKYGTMGIVSTYLTSSLYVWVVESSAIADYV